MYTNNYVVFRKLGIRNILRNQEVRLKLTRFLLFTLLFSNFTTIFHVEKPKEQSSYLKREVLVSYYENELFKLHEI